MDLLFELIVWIFKAITKPRESDSSLRPNQSMRPRQVPSTLSYSEQKTAEIWRAYRIKQEALEAEFRAKAPK